jgi:hypothetical protein
LRQGKPSRGKQLQGEVSVDAVKAFHENRFLLVCVGNWCGVLQKASHPKAPYRCHLSNQTDFAMTEAMVVRSNRAKHCPALLVVDAARSVRVFSLLHLKLLATESLPSHVRVSTLACSHDGRLLGVGHRSTWFRARLFNSLDHGLHPADPILFVSFVLLPPKPSPGTCGLACSG